MPDRSRDLPNDLHIRNQENVISRELRSSRPAVQARSDRVASLDRRGGLSYGYTKPSGYRGCADPRSNLQAYPDVLSSGEVDRFKAGSAATAASFSRLDWPSRVGPSSELVVGHCRCVVSRLAAFKCAGPMLCVHKELGAWWAAVVGEMSS
ncbi:hypothetical protein Droror1_Dr00004078 [Drosera rotundifolia]